MALTLEKHGYSIDDESGNYEDWIVLKSPCGTFLVKVEKQTGAIELINFQGQPCDFVLLGEAARQFAREKWGVFYGYPERDENDNPS